MMHRPALTSLALVCALVLIVGCSSSSRDTHEEPDAGQEEPGGGQQEPTDGQDNPVRPSIGWGPRIEGTVLSPLFGAEDRFDSSAFAAVARAARAEPTSGSQSTTDDEMSVRVTRDDDEHLVHEFTDSARIALHVPSLVPRQGFDLAAFTDLIPGIEPDVSSYPHEVLGVWAWEGDVGAFWSKSPEIPPVDFGHRYAPVGTATYEGNAAGIHAVPDAATKFVADVEMVADFDAYTMGGRVDGFRTLEGGPIGDLAVTLDKTSFARDGAPFSGSTSSAGAGAGKWGGRWSDGMGWTMGGTFGFAADDESMAVLGAFTACSCASIAR